MVSESEVSHPVKKAKLEVQEHDIYGVFSWGDENF